MYYDMYPNTGAIYNLIPIECITAHTLSNANAAVHTHVWLHACTHIIVMPVLLQTEYNGAAA